MPSKNVRTQSAVNEKEAYKNSHHVHGTNQKGEATYPERSDHGRCGERHLETLGKSRHASLYNPDLVREFSPITYPPGCLSNKMTWGFRCTKEASRW